MESKNFLTIKETPFIFFDNKISVASLYRLVQEGKLPAIRVGKKYLINYQALQAKYN